MTSEPRKSFLTMAHDWVAFRYRAGGPLCGWVEAVAPLGLLDAITEARGAVRAELAVYPGDTRWFDCGYAAGAWSRTLTRRGWDAHVVGGEEAYRAATGLVRHMWVEVPWSGVIFDPTIAIGRNSIHLVGTPSLDDYMVGDRSVREVRSDLRDMEVAVGEPGQGIVPFGS